MADSNMRAAIEAALATDPEDTAPAAEVTDDDAVAADDAQSEESTEGDDTADEATSPEGDEGPDEYFGVSLKGLSREERDAIVAGFTERDKFIQQLLRNKPEDAADEAPPADPPEDTGAVDDAEILKALGLDDPDDPYTEKAAQSALPLAKLVLSLQDEVSTLKQRTELEATERYWENTLTSLESQFGTLPVSHQEVMQQAANAGVGEPVDAFWRIMGPARQAVLAEVTKRREAVTTSMKKGAKANVRPADQASGSDVVEKFTDVRDATKSAIASLLKERGIALEENE
jgi:hypothetical protein